MARLAAQKNKPESTSPAPPPLGLRLPGSNEAVDEEPSRLSIRRSTRTFTAGNPELLQMGVKTKPPIMESQSRPDDSSRRSKSASTEANQGFFHDSFVTVGRKIKKYNDTLGELQQLGISHVANLPELVLVGDQSAGKSSLMSGLAELDLPRSEGTCTRCPMHIRVSQASQWQCRVSLQQEYDFKPPADRRINKTNVTDQNPFPPWKKQPLVIRDFKTIYDKAEIEDVLRWAQVATLNHNRNFELFIPESGAVAKNGDLQAAMETTDASFSPNTVALEIKGPDLPDLSFYDLPGIFNNPSRDEDMYLVEVVKNLTLKYIKHKEAIIMWALPMNADVETSSTFGLIRQMDAKSRTIGVITKSDLLPAGNHSKWLRMLSREEHLVDLGYFVTMRSPNCYNLEDAKKREELFFNGTSGEWPEEFTPFHDRCGVQKLVAFLSEQLCQEFAKNLPSIKNKVANALIAVGRKLETLPELPDNIEYEVWKSLNEFKRQAQSAINSNEFFASWENLSRKFQNCIGQHIKPKIDVRHESDKGTIDLNMDDDEVASPTPTPHRKRPAPSGAVGLAAKRSRNDTPSPASVFERTSVKREGSSVFTPSNAGTLVAQDSSGDDPFNKFISVGSGFRSLDQIRDEINRKAHAGMPETVNIEVQIALCMCAVRPWDKPWERYLNYSMELLSGELNKVLQASLCTLQKRMLYKESIKYLGELLQEEEQVQYQRLKELYELENYTLYTIDNEAFRQSRREEAEILERTRCFVRAKGRYLIPFTAAQKPIEATTEDERNQDRQMMKVHIAKLGDDPFATEMSVAAYVRGYYKLAARRFVENVTMSVKHRLFREVSDKLDPKNSYLENKLGLLGRPDRSIYDGLMEEEKATAKKREQLKNQKEKLERALQSIGELEQNSDSPGVDFERSDSPTGDRKPIISDFQSSNGAPAEDRGPIVIDDED